jgi:hypothetical protein
VPESAVSDAAFLVKLRESKALSKAPKGLFGGFRLGWRAVAGCAVLFLAISFGSNYHKTLPTTLTDATLQQQAENLSGWLIIAEQASVVNPDSLATSLKITELSEIWDDTVTDQTSETDLLLALDDESFQAVLDELAATHFFNGNGS